MKSIGIFFFRASFNAQWVWVAVLDSEGGSLPCPLLCMLDRVVMMIRNLDFVVGSLGLRVDWRKRRE